MSCDEVKAIEESKFKFKPFQDKDGNPIKVSGKYGASRIAALKELLHKLAGRKKSSSSSLLEQERKRLPEKRQRILLLVGSYDEAKEAREFLESLRSDWKGQVLNLVADDDEFESDWSSSDRSLQRGLVYQLRATGAWILIAPLRVSSKISRNRSTLPITATY